MAITKEVLKTGIFVDANGVKVTFTEKDLDAIAANFDAATGKNTAGNPVPLTIAHPKTDSPAYGWVKRFYRTGQSLFAEFIDLKDKMLQALKDKSFRNVSIAISPGNIPRHIGVLGAWPPAVAGMADFDFAKMAIGTLEFGTDNIFTEYLTDFYPQNKGAEMAKTIEELNADVEKLTAEKKDGEAQLADAQKKITELDAKLVSSAGAQLAAEKRVMELEAEKKADAEKTADAADLAAIDGLIVEFKVPPAEKDLTLMALKTFRGAPEMEFSSADGKKEKKAPRQKYLETLQARPALFSSDELFTESKAAAAGKSKMDTLIEAKMKGEPGITFSLAARQVLAENSEINLHPQA